MRVLLAVLLVGIVGCGGGSSPPGGGAVPTPEGSQAKVDKSPAEADPVVTLEKFLAGSKRNEQGEVVEVDLRFSKITDVGMIHLKELTKLETLRLSLSTMITDAGLVHLKGLTNLRTLDLKTTLQITDAGLVHLKGLTNLQELDLEDTQATDAGIAELQKALPNCKIEK